VSTYFRWTLISDTYLRHYTLTGTVQTKRLRYRSPEPTLSIGGAGESACVWHRLAMLSRPKALANRD